MKSGIINCDLTLKQCDKDWSELEKTKSDYKRFCLDCERMVQKVDNSEDLREVINQKKCVAYFMEDEPPLIGLISPSFDFEDNNSDDDLPFD